MEEISCKDARDHLAEVMNKVMYGNKRYTLTRRGSQMAVIISYDEWQIIEKKLQKLEDEEDLRDARLAMKRLKKDGGVSLKQLKEDIGM